MNKLLIAFTSGVILGILYAPSKGQNTRNRIANLGNDLKERWNDVTDKVADGIDSIRMGVDDMADRAVEKVEGVQFDTPNRIV